MTKLFSVLSLFTIGTIVTIYSLNIGSIDDGLISFNNYRGKKILLVNTATQSSQANQLTQLQQLYVQNQDSLIIIAFPSNSFGNEPGTNAEIRHIMRDNLGLTYPIASKSSVSGADANMVYRWTHDKSQNNVLNDKVATDFHKILIDKKGFIVGVFDSSVSPLSSIIINAIHHN